jgi:hypothetical protein
MNPALFQLFNCLAGASAGLTEHVNWNFLRTTLALKSARIEVVERDQLRARDMRGGELARTSRSWAGAPSASRRWSSRGLMEVLTCRVFIYVV